MTATKNKGKEIRLERLYDAPVKRVWDAWVEPDQVAQWWGPRGYTITSHRKDIRTGGLWHYTMHGPDGVDYVNKTKYLEVVPYAKMVYDHGGNDEQKPLFRVTVTFQETAGKTLLNMTMALPTPEAADQTRGFIKKANGNSTWDRLAEYLVKSASGKEVFVINRSFDAPQALLFDLWTQPDHLARWMGPKGSQMKVLRRDFRPGGESFYSMSMGEGGPVMYGKLKYLEIAPPERLVYLQQFSDEKGGTARHPMAPTWPETMRTTLLLTPEEGGTRVTLLWEPVDAADAEIGTFVQGRSGMTGGWTGSFDALEEYLQTLGGQA
ncbi:MAG TPA: SRPBCC family protein [bacterium]|nr:SRPBCC family protein [bacterium]